MADTEQLSRQARWKRHQVLYRLDPVGRLVLEQLADGHGLSVGRLTELVMLNYVKYRWPLDVDPTSK